MNILSTIGNTPILLLENFSKEAGANIYIKAETFNPGGSIKDRASFAYLDLAMKRGEIEKGDDVVEASSGNLGIGLALVCRQLELNLTICMSEGASIERRKLIQSFGAKIALSPANKGMAGAIALADSLIEEKKKAKHKVFRPDQFSNPDGPKMHYEQTAPEIQAFCLKNNIHLDAFVAGIGSGATFTGIGRFLKEKNSNIYLCPVEPKESAVLSGNPPAPHGIQGIGAGFVPSVLDTSLISEILQVSTQEAIATAQALANREGINAGISTGANLAASLMLAKKPEFQGKNILTIACDTGERYMSTDLFA